MDEFDFTDGLKIVLVSVFMLGSVQLHALIDESTQHSADRAERAAAAPSTAASANVQRVLDRRDSFDEGEARLRKAALRV